MSDQFSAGMGSKKRNLEGFPIISEYTGPEGLKFDPYMDKDSTLKGLEQGDLIQGILKITKNRGQGFLKGHELKDICIQNQLDINRALDGDLVAVKVNPMKEWKILYTEMKEYEEHGKLDIFKNPIKMDTPEKDVVSSKSLDGADLQKSSKNLEIATEKASVVPQITTNTEHLEKVGNIDITKLSSKQTEDFPEKKIDTKSNLTTLPLSSRETNEPIQNSGSKKSKKKIKKKKINLTVKEVMKHSEWPKFVQKTGVVVHILEKKHSRLTIGHLELLPHRNANWALFTPKDSRVPGILIPMSDCPQNFYHRPVVHSNVLFLAEIIQWDDNSIYASGRLVKELGNTGDIEAETKSILIENGVDFEDFNEDVLSCLPQDNDWTVPSEELKSRRDFRDQCVFSIDPSSALDMDDAVSCDLLENGNFEVGVHIADVTFFVPEGSKLDAVASERSTSVYLVQKVVPMLPRKLCEDLCSLNPGKDRLTFSVVWEISSEGEIFRQWIGRTVINSCCKLSYQDAQEMIENPTRVWSEFEHLQIYGGFNINDILRRVNDLHVLAVMLRKKRMEERPLEEDQREIEFSLNEKGFPTGYYKYVQKDSNKLIEEFMILANMCVAKIIYRAFPSLSLLRRHPPPDKERMNEIASVCKNFNINLDPTTSETFEKSIFACKKDNLVSNPMFQGLSILCKTVMNSSEYVCTGALTEFEKIDHFGLNLKMYTHFTSPIRRFVDIIVHRLLGAALKYNLPPDLNAAQMQRYATYCNKKSSAAKSVSKLSKELNLAEYIKRNGPLNSKGIITKVKSTHFEIFIYEINMTRKVYCNNMDIIKKEYKCSNVPQLILTLENKEEEIISLLTIVKIALEVKESLQIHLKLTH